MVHDPVCKFCIPHFDVYLAMQIFVHTKMYPLVIKSITYHGDIRVFLYVQMFLEFKVSLTNIKPNA